MDMIPCLHIMGGVIALTEESIQHMQRLIVHVIV